MSDRDSKRSLTSWFSQWRGPLRKFLRGRSSLPAADLEDIAQEAFLRLMRYDQTELIEHPQAYLFKVASSVAGEWALRWRNARPHNSEWLGELVSTDEPAQRFARESAEREVWRAIDTLGSRERQMLKLYFLEGLGHAEIAERLGITRRSVKRVLIKSYDKLRHELDPELLGVITDGRE